METSSVRVLVVEDSEPFRRFICSTLEKRPEFQVVGKVVDGLEAIEKAEELQPDLILLDIGLPSLNGIEAARRMRKVSPESKIVFVSQESSPDLVQEALRTGACGYIVKSDAGKELLGAIETVRRGNHFVGRRFSSHDFVGAAQAGVPQDLQSNNSGAQHQQNMKIARRHDVGFYSENGSLLDGFTGFIGDALMGGKAVIVVATESHRDSFLLRLQSKGVDIAAAIEEGRYIALDAAETLSTFMVNGSPDPVRFQKAAGDLIVGAAKAVNGELARVAACGECAPLLWAQGNMEAAIRVEHLWDEIARAYKVDILCGYSFSSFQGGVGSYAFEKICSEHSAVHFR